MASVEEWQEGGENVPASAVCPVAQIPCLEVTGPKTMMGRYQEETLGAGGIEYTHLTEIILNHHAGT